MTKMICITCPNSCRLEVDETTFEVIGNKCNRGIDFAKTELTNPTRSVCSTVKTIFESMPVLPVRTDGEISKNLIFNLMQLLNTVTINKELHRGDIVIQNVLDSGVNIIATSDITVN